MPDPSRSRTEAVLPWALRAAWVVLPLTAGPALSEALSGAQRPVQVLTTVGLWGLWGLTLGATLVPLPVGLTFLRVLTPAAVVAAVATALGGADAVALGVATGSALVAAALTFSPVIGQVWVQAASYGDESRFLLRPPGALLLGPIPLAWAVVVAGAASGPLLLANEAWLPGAVALVVGVPVAAVAARALHQLTRRLVVFVPAGLVLVDHAALADPLLVRRGVIAALGPALAGTTATDLTVRAPGLALEIRLADEVAAVVIDAANRRGRPMDLRSLIFTPSRPGAVLAEARRRRIPVAVA